MLRRRLDRRVRVAPPAAPAAPRWPDAGDAVARYLRFMGAAPSDRNGDLRVRFTGSFFKAGSGWMPATAWQFNSAQPVERRYVMRIRMGHVVPMIATDTYRDGHGEMTGKLLGATVARGAGSEFDEGELVTWLNDAVLLAPGLLFDAGASVVELDDAHLEVTLSDSGITVTGVVELDVRGAPVLFSTRNRFADLPTGPVRAEWQTPVTEWARTEGGRAVPVAASAVWVLPTGRLTYVRGGFDPASLELRRPARS